MTENTTTASTQSIGGYEVPVDPMDLLQCDSCQ
ncbi:MAG: ribonucleotide-diphosphate reductase subunit beta [Leifsonia sp.]